MNKMELLELVNSKLKDYLFIVVSNREPYIHNLSVNGLSIEVPAVV